MLALYSTLCMHACTCMLINYQAATITVYILLLQPWYQVATTLKPARKRDKSRVYGRTWQGCNNLVTWLLPPGHMVATTWLQGCRNLVTGLPQPGYKLGTTLPQLGCRVVTQPCYMLVTTLSFLYGCIHLGIYLKTHVLSRSVRHLKHLS